MPSATASIAAKASNVTIYILQNTIGYTEKGREHMHPENQGNAGKKAGGIVLQIVIASVFAIALALLTFFVWQLKSDLTSLQDSLDFTAMNIDTIQGSIERPTLAFSIASYKLDYKKDEYGESYSGNVIIACDQPDPCIVMLKTTLASGGSAYTEDASYSLVIVRDGIGRYSTFDWGEPGKIEKPLYKFEIIGYFKAEKNGD